MGWFAAGAIFGVAVVAVGLLIFTVWIIEQGLK